MEKEQNEINKKKKSDVTEDDIPEANTSVKNENNDKNQKEEKSPEDRILDLEDKLARTLAEMENQRRRFEKEKEEAYEWWICFC